MASYTSLITGSTESNPANASQPQGANSLIPLQYADQIVSLIPATSVARKLFRTVNMGHEMLQVPVLDTLPKAEWVEAPSAPGKEGEGYKGLEGTTEAAWKAVQLTAKTVAINVPIPRTVLADSMFPIWSEVTPLIAAELGRTLDAAVLFGTNSPFSAPSVVPGSVSAGNTYTLGTATKEEGSYATDIAHLFDLVEAESGFSISGAIASKKLKALIRQAARTTFGELLEEVSPSQWYDVDVDYLAAPGLWPQAPATGLKGTVAEKTKEVTLTTGETTKLAAGDSVTITGITGTFTITSIVSSTVFKVNHEFSKAEKEAAEAKVAVTVVAPQAIAGDFSQAILGVRQDLEFQIFDTGVITDNNGKVTVNLMTQNMVNLRVQARFAYAVANSVTYYQSTESKRYPFAVAVK